MARRRPPASACPSLSASVDPKNAVIIMWGEESSFGFRLQAGDRGGTEFQSRLSWETLAQPFPRSPSDFARQLPSWHVQAVFTLLARWPPLPSSRKRPGPPPASLALQSCKNPGCPMPVIPIPRRVRSFHGPHTTCLHSACGPVRTAPLVRTKYNNFDIYLKSRWMYGVIRFLLYFSCSLFTSVLWVVLAALFCIQYLSIRFFLRFQHKLSITLLLMGRRRLDFSLVNELLIYAIHVTMLLVGGLGWCFMVFVDM